LERDDRSAAARAERGVAMASRREWLENVAIDIVAEGHEPDFYQLQRELQQAGASHAEANQTILRLRGQGVIKTTFTGRFVMPGQRRRAGGGGGGHGLSIAASVLGIIVAVLGIWEIGARNGVIPGPGPIGIVFPSGSDFPFPSFNPNPSIPEIKSGQPLDTPSITISGDCVAGYTVRWDAVAGAEDYQVRENGHFRATTSGTDLFIPSNEVLSDLRITVIAKALTRPDSPESNAELAAACS
jgi:hypothetical protein